MLNVLWENGNMSTKNLVDYIKVYKNSIEKSKCDFVIENSKNYDWKVHEWSNYLNKADSESPDTEFQRAPITGMSLLMLNSAINSCIDNYTKNGNLFLINGFTPPNLNKYDQNTQMLIHHDHIYSCFDGSIRGIPILSVVGLLNDNFSGGEFIFWEDHKIDLSCGDILIFPSNFMYKHSVKTITHGTRYSFVSWAY